MRNQLGDIEKLRSAHARPRSGRNWSNWGRHPHHSPQPSPASAGCWPATGQVYLVREGCPVPSCEADYDWTDDGGAAIARLPRRLDLRHRQARRRGRARWHLGAAVDPAAHPDGQQRTRLPAVPRWRLLDGKPLLVARARALRHPVYGGAVVRAIGKLLEAPPTPGQAFNLAQPEQLTVRELIERIAARAGARPDIVERSTEAIEAAGLSVRNASPFSSAWSSLLTPRAR